MSLKAFRKGPRTQSRAIGDTRCALKSKPRRELVAGKGLRSCLLQYPFPVYYEESEVERG